MTPQNHPESAGVLPEGGSQVANVPGGAPAAGPRKATPLAKWLLGAVVLLLLAYPFVRRMIPQAGSAAGEPADVSTLLNRSFQQYQSGQYVESIATAREALKLNPHSEVAYTNIAAAYGGLQMWDDAIQNSQEALKIRPDFPLAQNNLAWFLSRKQGGAAASSTPASQSAADHLNASLQHYNAGRYQQCIDEANEALKLKSDYAEAYNNLAAGYIGLGNWDEAISSAQQALRVKPDFTLASNNLRLALQNKSKGAVPRK